MPPTVTPCRYCSARCDHDDEACAGAVELWLYKYVGEEVRIKEHLCQAHQAEDRRRGDSEAA